MFSVEEQIKQDNVNLRRDYLREFSCYTPEDINAFASTDANDTHDYAALWEQQNKIFSVNDGDIARFPTFQFKNGKPLDTIESVLPQLPRDMSNWEIAFWFSFPNAHIENERAPKDSFEAPGDLNAAIKALSYEITG